MNALQWQIGESSEIYSLVAVTRSKKIKASSVIWTACLLKLSGAIESSLLQQSQQTTQAQVHIMKDFDECHKYSALSYLGSKSDVENPLILDLSPLKHVEPHINTDLSGITLKSLLVGKDYDGVVEKLVALSQFRKVNCNFQEAKLYHARYKYKNHSIFYPLMKLSFNPQQLHCIQQLKFIIAIRKTYCAIGEKYYDVPNSFQALQKIYALYLDEILRSKSIESLKNLEKDMMNIDLLFTPLETNWIASKSKAVQEAVKDYNKHLTIKSLLNFISTLHKYHVAHITESKKRCEYLLSLNTFSGFQALYDQLLKALKIFLDKDQISGDLCAIPCTAFSETVLLAITFTARTNWEEDCQRVYTQICEYHPIMYTVVDQYFDSFAEYLLSLIPKTLQDLPGRKKSLDPQSDFKFEEAYIAFKGLSNIQTAVFAISVYTDHIKSLLRLQKKWRNF